MASVGLGEIAYARSGDKGSSANVGVIARTEEAYDLMRGALTAAVVARFFASLNPGGVRRYELPNLLSLNFVLPAVLGGGGGSVSLRTDAQGKALGQLILELPIEVPDDLLPRLRAAHEEDGR